jgi:hypothetical protein
MGSLPSWSFRARATGQGLFLEARALHEKAGLSLTRPSPTQGTSEAHLAS